MITSTEKGCDKVINPLNKLPIERKFLNMIKDIYKKPAANITINDKRQCFVCDTRMKAKGVCFYYFYLTWH